MAMNSQRKQSLEELQNKDLTNLSEKQVENEFIKPFLSLLGYNGNNYTFSEKDRKEHPNYFFLVNRGQKTIKIKIPDFTTKIEQHHISSLLFIIEAKKTKENFSFTEHNLSSANAQVLDYARIFKSLSDFSVLSNGKETYIVSNEPKENGQVSILLNFKQNELLEKWEEIYNYLGSSTILDKIINQNFNKDKKILDSCSTFDTKTPQGYLGNVKEIEKLAKKKQENIKNSKFFLIFYPILDLKPIIPLLRKKSEDRNRLSTLSPDEIDREFFNIPMIGYPIYLQYYFDKKQEEKEENLIWVKKLLNNFDRSSMFRQAHIFLLVLKINENEKDQDLNNWIKIKRNGSLNLLQKLELASLKLFMMRATITHVNERIELAKCLVCAFEKITDNNIRNHEARYEGLDLSEEDRMSLEKILLNSVFGDIIDNTLVMRDIFFEKILLYDDIGLVQSIEDIKTQCNSLSDDYKKAEEVLKDYRLIGSSNYAAYNYEDSTYWLENIYNNFHNFFKL
jgi:hypothetical protein